MFKLSLCYISKPHQVQGVHTLKIVICQFHSSPTRFAHNWNTPLRNYLISHPPPPSLFSTIFEMYVQAIMAYNRPITPNLF